MATHKIIITDSNYSDTKIEEKALREINAEVTRHQCKTAKDVIRVGKGADGLLNQYAPITSEVLNQLNNLKVVARYGIGIDTIDVEAATENGVAVVNVPSYCEHEVSNHALALILNCIRKVSIFNKAIKKGKWDWKIGVPTSRINNLTLGIVGLGKIGRKLVPKARPLGFKIIGYDPHIPHDVFDELEVDRKSKLTDLLAQADVISLHVPLNEETFHLIAEKELGLMKSSAILINTSRGAVIDNKALYKILNEEKIAMAGLDVIENEPPLTSIGNNSLTKLDNIILTPHTAWYSEKSLVELRTKTAQGAADILTGQENMGLVNKQVLPQLDLS